MSIRYSVGRWFVLLVVWVLGACSTPIDTNQPFSRQDSNALVVFGVSHDLDAGYQLVFTGYNPDTGEIISKFTGNEAYDRSFGAPRELTFTAGIWKPGFYRVSSYTYDVHTVRLSPSLYFEVKPGKINYIGNTFLGRKAARHMGFTDDLAKAYLANFRSVDADFSRVELHVTKDVDR